MDICGQDLEVFHAGCGVCWRSNRELKGVECAVGAPEDAEQERWCVLAVDLVGGGGLERHCCADLCGSGRIIGLVNVTSLISGGFDVIDSIVVK